jgi:serine/threonine-protein kinase
LAPGAKLGPYEIMAPLGAGGMGEVYRARDTRLDRDIAIKVLPDAMARDPQALARFEREAKAVAALSHPNILAVYDVGRDEDISYVVMELLEGETLRSRINRSALPSRKAVEVGTAIADGLSAAHARGVIHRDLKPENIFLTADGHVKILDFGLARSTGAVQGTTHDLASSPTMTIETRPGAIIGTLCYMAPEQIRALATDARTDIFAFGCVMYEMLTGRRAFLGETAADTMTAILKDEPTSIRTASSGVGLELERLIDRCLEKRPEQRFQSATDLAFSLRSLASHTAHLSVAARSSSPRLVRAGVPVVLLGAILAGVWVVQREFRKTAHDTREKIDSLAVLPLENVSRDAEQEYFVDGMTEALISDLAKIGGLKVISRTSVMRYKATTKALPEIAKELNVDAVVEGSVQRAGDRVRITAQLIHAATDEHLWSESYDRDLRDVLRLQSEVARTIANEIKVTLTPQEQARMGKARTVNPQAYQAYLKGRFHWNKRTPDGLEKAVEYFEQAIALAPDWPLGYAGLADAYLLMPWYSTMRSSEAKPKARTAAAKALEMDESLAEAHATIAVIAADYDRDWPTAEQEFQRALALSPNYATAHQWYALQLRFKGRHDEAIREATKAQELDPLSLIISVNVGEMHYYVGDLKQAETQFRKTLEFGPDFAEAHIWLVRTLFLQARYPEATTQAREAVRVSNNDPSCASMLAYVYAKSGQTDEARRILSEITARSREAYVAPTHFSFVHAGLEERDQMFEWLERAHQEHDVRLLDTLIDPLLAEMRGDPRFADLVRRVGLPPLTPIPSTTLVPPPLPKGDKGGSATGKIMLAVLPFENLSRDPEQEYFSDGLTEEMITQLGRLNPQRLGVIARTSAMHYKGTDRTIPHIRQELGVDYVIEGSVRRYEDEIRITASLIDTKSQTQIWTDSFAPEMKNLLTWQSNVARAIAKEVKVTLTPQEQARMVEARGSNPEAHDLYLRGRFLAFKQTEEGLRKGLEYFEKAIEKDPNYAPAYAGMAFAYIWLADAFAPPTEAYPQAKTAVLKAVELDDTNAEAHTNLGLIRWFYDWDFESTDAEFLQAQQLSPNSMDVHIYYALVLCGMNRLDEGLAESDRAISLDPLSPMSSWLREYCLVMAHRYDEAIAQQKKTAELDANFFYLESYGALAYRGKGMFAESIAEYHRLQRLIGTQPMYGLAITYARMGRSADARRILKEYLELSERKYVSPDHIALIYASLGEKDQAFAWLDRAYEARSAYMVTAILNSPDYDPLRSDPRFEDLVRRIGLAPFAPKPAKSPSAQPAAQKTRLAVLPFANDSGDKELDYLGEGIAETLINGFSRVEAVSMVPRSLAFQHKGVPDPVQAGRQLSATAILSGRILKRGDSLTVQADLVDVGEGRQLWGERYQRRFDDLVAIERDIAADITDALRLRLTGEEKRKLSRGYSENAEAYRLYLQGRHWWSKRTKEGLENALRLLGQAIELDPQFALAHSGIADTYSLMPMYGFITPRAGVEKAQAAAERALQLDDQLAEAHTSMGMVRMYGRWEFEQAEKDFKHALELNPRYPTLHQWYALCVAIRGRLAEAQTELRRAIELDPLAPIFTHNLAWISSWERDWTEALSIAKTGLDFAPEFPWLHQIAGQALLELDRADEALAHFRKAAELAPLASFPYGYLGYALGRAGREQEARALLAERVEYARNNYVPPTDLAAIHAGLGEIDEAFEWLEKAYQVHDTWMVFLAMLPQFETLHSDSRFADLLRRIALPPQATPGAGGVSP